MRTKPVILALVTVGLLHTAGCASIVNGQNQPISVVTPGCEKASCELHNDKGKWFVPATPGSVTVSRSYADLQVRCTRDEAAVATASVRSATKGMAFGNIIFGGVIGAGVDVASGAAYDYPNEVSVPMDCRTSTASAAATSTPVATAGVGIRLGCVVKNVTQDLALATGLAEPTGVMVTAISPQSVANDSGLRVGDVLTAFNDTPIPDSARLRDLLQRHPTGTPATVKVFRERRLIDIQLKLTTEGEV